MVDERNQTEMCQVSWARLGSTARNTISVVHSIFPLSLVFAAVSICDLACSDMRATTFVDHHRHADVYESNFNLPSPCAMPFWNSPTYLLLSAKISCPAVHALNRYRLTMMDASWRHYSIQKTFSLFLTADGAFSHVYSNWPIKF